MDCCGIQPLPPVNAPVPAPLTLNQIPLGSTQIQVDQYNTLLIWVNSVNSKTWFDIFTQLQASSTYSTALTALSNILATAPATLSAPRILIASPSGGVFYDSKTGTTNQYTYTPSGFKGNTGSATVLTPYFDGYINSNHNTRPDVISSLIFNPSGYGYATYQSGTTSTYNTYVSKRIGSSGIVNSFIAPGCTVRVSSAITNPFTVGEY
uniref:Uncharacterized protein n=1 Tax=viral metagenome TaxID=1070528 RepID=A0A6C0K167_9ZZZZ